MAKAKKKEKLLGKGQEKAENIRKATEAYINNPDLSMRDAAKIYHCSPSSVSNHVKSKENSTKQPIMHHADADVDRQLLTPGEEAALERHIHRCYGSGLALTTPLLRGFANELLKAKGSDELVGKKWHLRFYKRHPNVEARYSRPMERARVINENADNYIE